MHRRSDRRNSSVFIRGFQAFDLMPNETLARQTDGVFVDLRGDEPGVPTA